MLYLETVGEFLKSIEPLKKAQPELFEDWIVHCITQPQRLIEVLIPWQNDHGEVLINHAYRVGHSNILGPFKGGLRFRKDADITLFKILAFEQSMKNSLAQLDLGGAKGGSDFDPSKYSETEIESYCRAFIDHMHPYFGVTQDVPAGDIGVSAKEISIMVDQLKKYQDDAYRSFTGKALEDQGAIGRAEATGYGLIYFTQAHLQAEHSDLNKKRVIITGSGNVALNAAKKALEYGAIVLSLSDSSGAIYHPQGIDVEAAIAYKANPKQRLSEYQGSHQNFASYKELFTKPADLILPCATQNEIDEDDLKQLDPGVVAIIEGSNKACTRKAIDYLHEHEITHLPSKAANAGGVIVSSYEMIQNQNQQEWTFESTMEKLEADMKNIYNQLLQAIVYYRLDHNFLQAANIIGYKRLAETLIKRKQEKL